MHRSLALLALLALPAACSSPPGEETGSAGQAILCTVHTPPGTPCTVGRPPPPPPPPTPQPPSPPIALAVDHVEPQVVEEGNPVTVFFTAKNLSSTVRTGQVHAMVAPAGGSPTEMQDEWGVVGLAPGQTMSGAISLVAPSASLGNSVSLFYAEGAGGLASTAFPMDVAMVVTAGYFAIGAKSTEQWNTDDDHGDLRVSLIASGATASDPIFTGAEEDLGVVTAGGSGLFPSYVSPPFDLLPQGLHVIVEASVRTTGQLAGCNSVTFPVRTIFDNGALGKVSPGGRLTVTQEFALSGTGLCGAKPDYTFVMQADRLAPSPMRVVPAHARLAQGAASFDVAQTTVTWSVDGSPARGTIDQRGHYAPPSGGLPQGSVAVVRAKNGASSAIAVVEP